MKVGFVVNPIAGMGGRVGLKGTDGKLQEALSRGAEARAPARGRDALRSLKEHEPEIDLVTWGGAMGATAAREVSFDPIVLGGHDISDEAPTDTGPADTRAAVRALLNADVDLILFVGGDGTAVDVAQVIEEVDDSVPMLGVPAGVKVFSSTFAVSPEAAGRIVATFEEVEDREVVDLDEQAYREGRVEPTLRAVATVPVAEQLQASKQLAAGTVEGVAAGVAADVSSDTTYILGPGSTVQAIKQELGFDGTPLGVDVWRDGAVMQRDGSESDILDVLTDNNLIIVSPIGGQGFIFGRGNDQLSPTIIRRCDIEIVSSRRKLVELDVLRVDTGDSDLDDTLRGWHSVRIGRFERRMVKVV